MQPDKTKKKKQNKYVIRRAEDFGDIIDMHHTIFPSDEFPPIPKSKIMALWEVMFEKERVGFAIATIVDGHTMFLCRAGILQKHKGNGLHRRLIKCREKFAKGYGCSFIVTYVSKDGYRSFCNLIRMGYEIYDPAHKYVGDDFLYFRKVLKKE